MSLPVLLASRDPSKRVLTVSFFQSPASGDTTRGDDETTRIEATREHELDDNQVGAHERRSPSRRCHDAHATYTRRTHDAHTMHTRRAHDSQARISRRKIKLGSDDEARRHASDDDHAVARAKTNCEPPSRDTPFPSRITQPTTLSSCTIVSPIVRLSVVFLLIRS